MYDLVIENGKVVTPGGVHDYSIGVKDGSIAALSTEKLEGQRVVDASGKVVMPGAIDPHVHFALPFQGAISADDYYSGSVAGAFGGVTTFIDFAIHGRGTDMLEHLKARQDIAGPDAIIDYGFHAGFTEECQKNLDYVKTLVDMGIPTFKLLLPYVREGFAVGDGFMYRMLEQTAEHGGLLLIHAENAGLVMHFMDEQEARGKVDWMQHYDSRPNFVEATSIATSIELAKQANAALYVVHLSTGEGLEHMHRAQSEGHPMIVETCHQFLEFTNEKYNEPDGNKYYMTPPFRTAKDNDMIWEGIQNGSVNCMGTDHCPFTLEQKNQGLELFSKVPNGIMGIETMLPYMFSEGVNKGRITLTRLAQLVSENTAKIHGLTHKGSLEVGKDADIAIIDPNLTKKVTVDDMHSQLDYTVYESVELTGWPVMTISRGEVIVEDGELKAERGRGKFVERRIAPEVLKQPPQGGLA
jgi:dihydropyrimidinase